jgi:5-methylcytosine-specific restriction endonuclease McrA
MSHFSYVIDLPNHKAKEGRTTAKSKKEAIEQITKLHPDGSNLTVEVLPLINKKAANKTPQKATVRGLSKLEKYLYLQHGKCFFCGENLPLEYATIEHLNPTSKGGSRTEDNEVACCASVNHTFGDMDLKRKFEFVLNASSSFRCPPPQKSFTKTNPPKKNDKAERVDTPANHGKSWTEKEEKQLASRYDQKMEVAEIAERHKRGVAAIRARLVKLGRIDETNQATFIDLS